MTTRQRSAAALALVGAVSAIGVARLASPVGIITAQAPATPPAAPTDAWPRFRGSPGLSGIAATVLPSPLKLRWTYEAKDGIWSSAAIEGGTVYVASTDGTLHAIDLATGKARWLYQTGSSIEESSPALRAGVVYVGDLDGVVHAVDAGTGKARWTFKTEGEIRSSPNWADERIYIGSYDTSLYCLSAATGELVWKHATDGPVHATPGVDRGLVYISGCDEQFRAIDAGSGKPVYSVPLGAYAGASAVVAGGEAYVGTFANEVVGLDLARRRVKWTYRHPSRSLPFYASAALTADHVVVGGRDKMVHCLARATGRARWTFLTRARVDSSPLVAGGRVFVGSSDGTLYELDLATGKKTWEFTAGAPLTASPAAAEGALVIGSQDGDVYCFGR